MAEKSVPEQGKMKAKGWSCRRIRSTLIAIYIFSLFLSACVSNPVWIPIHQAPEGVYPGEHWQKIERPEQLGWSSEKLLLAQEYSKKIGSAAVMIVQDGVVVAAWGDVERNFQCHSMRKSLLSGLIGIHVDDGDIDLSATLAQLGIDEQKRQFDKIVEFSELGDFIWEVPAF